jgi:hypothetical protein
MNDDPSAALDEALGDGFADAAAGAGDEHLFILRRRHKRSHNVAELEASQRVRALSTARGAFVGGGDRRGCRLQLNRRLDHFEPDFAFKL